MKLRLIAAGTRLPEWIDAGFDSYARRLPPESRLELSEIRVVRHRSQGADARALTEEGARMLAAIAPAAWVVALDAGGRSLDTPAFARWLAGRMRAGRDLAFLIGGPEGLAPACRARANEALSLSALTYAHGLVRVVLAEQLYRAISLLKGHPYHRE